MTNTPFTWEDVGEKLTDSIKWNVLRSYRNKLLTESDWTQLPNAPSQPRKKPPGPPIGSPFETSPKPTATQTMFPSLNSHKKRINRYGNCLLAQNADSLLILYYRLFGYIIA